MVPVEETPVDDVMFRCLISWPSRLRFSSRRSRQQPPIVEDASPTLPSTEPPPPSPEPVHLTVLISMPTPFAHAKAGHENGGPPVVELRIHTKCNAMKISINVESFGLSFYLHRVSAPMRLCLHD